MRYEYSEEADITTVWILPCRTYVIDPDPAMSARTKCYTSCERKLLMKGGIPNSIDLTETYWMPYRRDGKHESKDSRYIVMYAHPVYEDEAPNPHVGREPDYTGVCLIIDSRCPQEAIADELDKAAAYMSEQLRMIVSDIQSNLIPSARVLERIMLDFSDAIEEYNDDETQTRYAALGLRKVDADRLTQ